MISWKGQSTEVTVGNVAASATTMNSRDLLDIINSERIAFGEPEVRHNQFVERCKDELEGEHYKSFVVTNPNDTTSEVLQLDLDQCMLVAMRESKGVRRAVQAKLKAQQGGDFKVPQNMGEALRLAADLSDQKAIAEAQRDEAVKQKAWIGNKREATAMATASTAKREVEKLKAELGRNQQHATVIAVERATGREFAKNVYVGLRNVCRTYGLSPVDVVDARYGSVKAWPAIAWRECHGIDLAELFAVEVA